MLSKLFLIHFVAKVLPNISYAYDEKPLDISVCKAARAKTDYKSIVNITEEVKMHTKAYKKVWFDLCDHKKTASIHETFRMAKILEEKFKSVI